MTTTDRPSVPSDVLVDRVASASIPTVHGEFTAHAYRVSSTGEEHLAYVMGDVASGQAPLVRLHSECLTGDVLRSDRCDCGRQLDQALERIAGEGRGALVYLRGHEGRGIGIGHKIRAYAVQDSDGLDTVDANLALGLPVDARDYAVGAMILRDLGLASIRLMTNNPVKISQLEANGFEIVEQLPIVVDVTPHNKYYLAAKRDRLGHTIL